MKPLIWFDYGLHWVCMYYPDPPPRTVVGYGDTPAEAYADWEKEMELLNKRLHKVKKEKAA
ncbi:hypothetical protein [Xanthomonas sp. LMG 12461]|uniref:hypothetical protein n=1 Tax=Xanthomonas sp. LMG 12461 TaxID=2014543 RepID=UPI001265A583|nr:hypothetical protein [Xanthomonas sp. LMG 12461]